MMEYSSRIYGVLCQTESGECVFQIQNKEYSLDTLKKLYNDLDKNTTYKFLVLAVYSGGGSPEIRQDWFDIEEVYDTTMDAFLQSGLHVLLRRKTRK